MNHMIRFYLKPVKLSAEARKRQVASLKVGQESPVLIDLSEREAPAPRSIDIAAAAVGVSPATAWREGIRVT